MSAASRPARAFAIMAALVMLLMVANSTVVNLAFAGPFVSPAVDVNNNTTPPPPSAVPIPPPDAPQRPVEPGTITQGWDNGSFGPAQIEDHRAPAMQQIGNETWYDTADGNFVLNKSSPYFVRIASPGSDAEGIAESAFLVLYRGLRLLSPSNGTVDKATSDELSFHYGMYLSAAFLGTMKVDYRFHGDANKITISFSPSIGLAKQYQIVWLTFTTFNAIDTAYPSDVEQRFEDMDGRYGSLSLGASVGTLYGTGTIQIPGAFIRPQKIVGSPGGPDLRMDASDAAIDFNGTYAGKLTFGGYSGNAVLSTFVAGNLTIDPQLILNGVDQDATAYSGIQRKTFFDGDRYWLFYKYTGGGVSEARYRSSLDGRSWTSFSDAIQIPGTLSYDFTVANSGKTVAVFWVNSASLLAIQIRTGLIVGDAIQWDDAGHQLFSGNNNIRRPVSATFTSQGNQFGITWSDTGGAVGFARYSCTGQGASGFSPCATQVQSGSVDWGYGSLGGLQYSVVATFNTGTGDIARFKIDSATDGKSYVRAKVYHADGTNCGDAADIGHSTAANGDAWMTDGLFTAAASGSKATILFFDTAAFTLYSYNLASNCNSQADLVRGLGTGNAKYLTAGTEQDGGALYLFYTVNGAGWYARTLGDGANSFSATTTFPPYTNPNYVTAAAVSSHFVPLMFTRAYPPPPGISDGCTSSWSNWCLYYVNYPLPLDGEAAVNNPWALKLGAPFITETGGVVSPTTGLLAYGQVLVAGMPSINLIYREPGLFSWDATNGIDVKYTSTDQRFEIVPGIYYDVPWLEGADAGFLHLRGGQKFSLSLTGASGSLRWYNNTRGVRYTLRYDGTTTQWTLTLPTGAYTVFNSDGNPIWTYLDATGQNYLQYNGIPGVTNAYIADASGRRITFTATGLSYGNGQTIGLTNLGVPAGCSGGTSGESAILQVTDSIGRVTKYSVCHWRLIKIETAMGGRVDYTYAVYNANPGSGNQVWQGTEAYSLPLLRMDVYNESGANVKARSAVFNYVFQNGEVVRASVNRTDKGGVVEGTNEYAFNSAMGTASVRAYDSAGQVLYFDMQTLSGTNMKDLSGNANDGTISGPIDALGRYGRARDFSGSSQWIETASSMSSLGMTDFATVSLWFQHDYAGTFPLNDVKGLFFKGANTGLCERNYEGSLATTGALSISWDNCSSIDSLATTTTYTDSSWHHMVGIFNWNAQYFAIYVDGTLAASKSSSVPVTATAAKLVLGKVSETSGVNRFFNGRLDEFRIFHRALSPEDVGALYTKNALKRGEETNWYSINDQPHLVEGLVGDETTASMVTQEAIDDWGNQIYHKDALGNETFASYANTNHQNHFYAPGSLTKNGGTLFDTEFIDFSEGTFPPGNSWTVLSGGQSINVDYSTFSKTTPSLKLTNSASTAVDIEHVSPLTQLTGMPRFIEFRARVDASQDYQVWLQKSNGALLAGVAFTSAGAIQVYNDYLAPGPYWASCTYPGGASVTYAINTWYRFTLEFDRDTSNVPWRVYLDGIDLSCGTLKVMDTASFYKFTLYEGTYGGVHSAWIDDIKTYNNANGLLTGYDALQMGFSGLQPRQAIQLVAEDGSIIDQGQWEAGYSNIFLSFNPVPAGVIPGPAPSGSYSYYENGDNAKTTVRIYAEDGTLEYQSPLTRFFVGARYTYTRSRAFADELVKTRSGALYWPAGSSGIYADEFGNCENHVNGITCFGTWIWRTADVAGAQADAVRGSYVHVTPFDYGVRTHSFTVSPSVPPPTYFMTYARIPEGGSPDGIGLEVYTGTSWKKAYWGTNPSDSSTAVAYMGPVPVARNQWIQLVVNSGDLGMASSNWYGVGYASGGGEVEWDVTTTQPDASLTVSGLSGVAGSGLTVGVYYANNGTLIATGSQSGDTANVLLYNRARGITSFPVNANIKIYDGSNEYYFGPARNIWPGDSFRYVGASSFFDSKASGTSYWPSSTIHNSQTGAKKFSGDCMNPIPNAILCYDMETATETSTAVDTGTVSSVMWDLSGKGSHGTIGGVPNLSTIDKAAAGLGTTFNAGSDEVAFTMPSVNTASGGWNSVSLWIYWTGTANQMPFGFNLYDLYHTGTYFGFNTGNGDLWGIDNTGLANTRVHVVAEFYNGAGTSSKLYINGVQKTLIQKIGTTLSRTATTNAKLSGWPYSSSYKFGGTLDQVIVYNRALTDTEVLALYHTRMPGSPQVYTRPGGPAGMPQTNGSPITSRIPYEGTYLYAAATYDAKGNVRTVTEVGVPRSLFFDMSTCVVMPCASGGSMVDLSSNGNNAALVGTTLAAGRIGSARQFNGIGDYADVPQSSSISLSNPLTVSFSAKWLSLPPGDGTCGAGSSSAVPLTKHALNTYLGSWWFELRNTGQLDFYLTFPGPVYVPFSGFGVQSTNQMYTYSATYDGQNVRLYRDGSLISTTPETRQLQTASDSLSIARGFGTGCGSKYSNAVIDEVHLIPQALSTDQVVNLYNGGTATSYVYSTLDGQDYRTQVIRRDGKEVYYAYDFQAGVRYGTLDVDCRRSRIQYDAIGRPLQTSVYDIDSNEVFHLDMETATYNSLKDVSCAGTTSSNNGQSVTMVGTAEVAGIDGSARSFNGGERLYVSSPSGLPLGSSPRTLTAWIYVTSYAASNAAMVISYGTTSATGYAFSLGVDPSGNVISDLQGGRATSTLVVPQNSWHFIAATYTSGTSVSLTLDTLSQTTTYSGSVTPNTQSGELDVGDWIAGSCCFFTGRIDEARLFTRSLSASELTDVMSRRFKLLTSSSAAYDDTFPTSVTAYDGVSTPRALFYDLDASYQAADGYWYMEDKSGHGQDGQLTGTLSLVAGKVGNARQFSTSSDKIRVASPKGLPLASATRTLSAWINPTSVSMEQMVAAYGPAATSGDSFAIGFDGTGKLFVDLYNGRATSTLSVTTGWHFVAAVYTGGSQVILYLDASSQTVSFTGTATTPNTAAGNFIVGQWASNSNYDTFNGIIDEVHLIPRDLSPTEVAGFYAGYNQGTFIPQNYPTSSTGTSTDCGGTDGGDWSNPANAYSSTDGGASATAAPSAGTIICTDWNTFNFNVPAGAVINSVKVTASYTISGTSGNHYGLHVGVVDTDGGVTNCPYQEDSSQPTVLTQVTFDFTSCKSWASADFNGNNIKVDVGGHRGTGGGSAKTFSLDYVSVQVSYTVGGSNSIDGSHLSRKYMDGLGRPVREVVMDIYGNKVQTVATVGWNDQPIYSFIPSGGYFTYTYDFPGRTLTVQTPGDSATSGISRIIVSEKARMLESIDAVGRKVYQKTDLLGRTVETGVWNPQTSAYGNLTSTTYNALSEVTVGKDAKLQTTTVYYNSLGKPKMTVFPDGTYSVVYYDDNLRAFQTVDVMGSVAISAYDNIGRVTSTTLQPSLGTSCTGAPNPCVVTYTYDPVHDDLLTIDNGTAKITRTYDSMHRMKTERLDVPSSGPTFTGTISYDYDNAGKILNITYPISGSPKAVYTYDSLGRVIQLEYGGSKYAVLTYDAFGRLDNIHYWKGSTDTSLQEKYAYDVRDRITQVKVFDSGQTYMQLDYTAYSKASEIVGSTDNMYVLDGGGVGSNPKTITYSYDGNGRLSKAVGPFGASQATEYDCYNYDQVGNIAHWGKGTTSCPTSGMTYYTYNPTGWNELASITNLVTSFGYNTAGSMLSKVEGSTTTYTQDFLQQLTTVVSGATTSTYSYDGLGRRVKTVDSSTSTTSYFMYSGSKMLYSKVGTTPTETAFVYVGDNLLLKKEGALDAQYYHNDISAGNVRLITHYNAGIAVDAKYRYKPFGDIIVLTTPGTDPRFKFAGTEFDSAVRLYQMGARYYDPVVGRFVSRDPIGGHGYAYAHDDPMAFRDPSGLDPWWHLFTPIAARPAAHLVMTHVAAQVKEAMATASWYEGASPQQRAAFVLSFLVNMGIGIGAGGLEIGSKICGAVGATGCAEDLARHAAAGVHWGEADAYNYFAGRLGAAPSAEGAGHSAFWAPTARAIGPIVLGIAVGAITDVPEVLDTGAAGEAGDAAAAAADAADTVGAGSASDLPDSFAEFFARQDDMMRSWEFYNVPYPDSAFEQLGSFMEWSESGYAAGVEGPTLREALRFIVEHGPLEAGTAEAAYRILRQLSGNGGKPAPIGPMESVAVFMP